MASGTAAATSTAATLADRGLYAQSIAIDEEIAARTGPLYVVDEGAATAALRAAEQTVMAWAAYLGRKGQVELRGRALSNGQRSSAPEAGDSTRWQRFW